MIRKMYLVLVICFLSFIVLACNEAKDDDKQNEVKEYNVTFVVDGSETIKDKKHITKTKYIFLIIQTLLSYIIISPIHIIPH